MTPQEFSQIVSETRPLMATEVRNALVRSNIEWSEDDVEDLCNSAVCTTWAIHQKNGSDQVGGLLIVASRHDAQDFIRKRGREGLPLSLSPEEDDEDMEALDRLLPVTLPPDSVIIDVQTVLSTLTNEDRRLVALYYYEGYTLDEIGELLGVTKMTVSRRLQSVSRMLRQSLASYGDRSPRERVCSRSNAASQIVVQRLVQSSRVLVEGTLGRAHEPLPSVPSRPSPGETGTDPTVSSACQ